MTQNEYLVSRRVRV